MLAFISQYQIKFDHARYAKLHGVGKISLRSSSSCVADSLFFILRNLLEMMLGHTCECDAQPPHHCQALFLDLLHPQLLLSQSLHQECPQQNHPNSCLWPSCLSSHFDRKISCSCYISSFCLLPHWRKWGVWKASRCWVGSWPWWTSTPGFLPTSTVVSPASLKHMSTMWSRYTFCNNSSWPSPPKHPSSPSQWRNSLSFPSPLTKPYHEGKPDGSFAFCRCF